MPWQVVLCAYKNDDTPLGHAFVAVTCNGVTSAAAGLSPSAKKLSGGGVMGLLGAMIPAQGVVWNERPSLALPGIKKRAWDVDENDAVKVLNKINADRRSFSGPVTDDSNTPAASLIKQDEDPGGPTYQLLVANCVVYALDLVATAGIDVSVFRRSISSPAQLMGAL